MTIELQAIELHGFHGVLEHERRVRLASDGPSPADRHTMTPALRSSAA